MKKKSILPSLFFCSRFTNKIIQQKIVLILVIYVCGGSLQAQPIGQITQGISALENGIWPNKTCSVCWENPGNNNTVQRQWVQDAVSSTWEKESGFRFTGWGTCNAASRGIRILIANEQPRTKALGTGLDGMKDGMVLNFNWSGCNETPEQCARKIGVHEFGHALGFAHEQNRKDAPAACQLEQQGATGDWWITPYDVNSVMNYCNPLWNNGGQLSEMDKYGVRLLYGGDGFLTDPILYGVNSAHELLWYKHTGHWAGTFDWSAGAGSKVGTGWSFRQVFSDGDGHLYAIQENGDMYWYNHIGFHDGAFRWSQTSRSKVGVGWSGGIRAALAAGGGVIYIIKDNGDLVWYKHKGYQDGSFTWDAASGKKIGSGWAEFNAVFSGGNGVIYLIDKKGDLYWYKNAGFNTGTNTWYGGASNKVGVGWLGIRQIFSTGWGNIYFVGADGALRYYNHLGFNNGTFTWGKGSGNKVGSGWSALTTIGMGGINPSLLSGVISDKVTEAPILSTLKHN